MLAPVGADGANGLGNLVVGLGDVRQLVGLAAEQSLDLLGGVAGDDGQHERDVVASLEHGPPSCGPALDREHEAGGPGLGDDRAVVGAQVERLPAPAAIERQHAADCLVVLEHGLDGTKAYWRGWQFGAEDHPQPDRGLDALGPDQEGGAEAVDGGHGPVAAGDVGLTRQPGVEVIEREGWDAAAAAAHAAVAARWASRQVQGSRVCSALLLTSPRTMRSSTSVSQTCGLTPFRMAVRTRVVAIAQLSPPPSLPAKSAARRVLATGLISRSTVFVCVPCEGALLSLVEIRAGKLSLQPEALGADQEVTNGLKHPEKRS